jgi:hypothetical protein
MSRRFGLLALVVGIVAGALVVETTLREVARSPLRAPSRTAEVVVAGVVRRAGEPAVADVSVYLVPPDEEIALADPVQRGRSGADGEFRFEPLVAGMYAVEALHEDGAAGWAEGTVLTHACRAHLEIDLSIATETLRGRIQNEDGSPFRGWVDLRLPPGHRRGPGRTPRRAWTDPEGRFVLRDLPQGAQEVTAGVPGARFVRLPFVLPSEHDEILFRIPTPLVIEGSVVSASDGRPIARAEIRSVAGVLDSGYRVLSDDRGRFTLPVPDGLRECTCEAPGFAPASSFRLDFAEGLHFPLPRAAQVAGRVVDARGGVALPGVRVSLALSSGLFGGPFRSTRTDAAGRYAFEGVPPGRVSIYALDERWQSPGLRDADADGFNLLAMELQAGERRTKDLLVVEGGAAEGQLADSEGNPFAGAEVTAIVGWDDGRGRPSPRSTGGGSESAGWFPV